MDKFMKLSTQKYLLSLYTSVIPGFKTETPTIPDPQRYQKREHKIIIPSKLYYKAIYYVNDKKINDYYWDKDKLQSNLEIYKKHELNITKSDKDIIITYKN